MERQIRKVQTGVVIGTKMDKTVVVNVTRRVRHPKYQNLVEKRKKYYAHNESENLKVGDEVSIMETRPLSKLKRWRVVGLVKK